MKKKKKFLIFLLIVALIFIFDRFTKIASERFSGCFIFCINRSVNYGAAFSIFRGFTWTRALLIIVALAVLFFTAFFYFRKRKFNYLYLGLILLFAGTLGNLWDRIFWGYVVDFIKFSFWLDFPAFNLADISNVAGVVLLIVSLIRRR